MFYGGCDSGVESNLFYASFSVTWGQIATHRGFTERTCILNLCDLFQYSDGVIYSDFTDLFLENYSPLQHGTVFVSRTSKHRRQVQLQQGLQLQLELMGLLMPYLTILISSLFLKLEMLAADTTSSGNLFQ